jgi:predicted chitinase
VRLKGYKELANHTYVKAGYTKKYGIIVLYDDAGKFQMLLQISGSDSPDQTVEQWLNYLAIVVSSDEQKEYDKSIWDKIRDRIGKLFTKEELPKVWGNDNKNDLTCHKCDKDLNVTHQHLMDVFPQSILISKNPVSSTYFQTAFEKAPLNGCHRIAHLLSQVYHESMGMQAKEEGLEYSLKDLLKTFNTTSTAKMFFKQSFWDDKEYLKYAVKDVYEMVDTAKNEWGDYDAAAYTTYKYNSSSTDTIRIPTSFTLNKGKGLYRQISLSDTQKKENKERWVNQVYGSRLGNGAPSTGDGYKYRGRGAIQLTGKDNYKRASKKCNDLFGTSYDWEANPDLVATDLRANIYAAIVYVLLAFPDLTLLDGTDVSAVTVKINSKQLGLSERQAKFNTLIQNSYKCK